MRFGIFITFLFLFSGGAFAQTRDLPTNIGQPQTPAAPTGVPKSPNPISPANTQPPKNAIGIQVGGQNPLLSPTTGTTAPTGIPTPGNRDVLKTRNLITGTGTDQQQVVPSQTAPKLPNDILLELMKSIGSKKEDETEAKPAEANDSISPVTPQYDSDSYFEPETDDDRIERELYQARVAALAISDPDNKAAELNAVKKREEARKNWLQRRAIAENGADFFIVPKLKETFIKGGWCQLFDGKTPFGWKTQKTGHYAGGQFFYENGEIRSDPYHPGLIYTQCQFKKFDLRFEYQAEKDAEVYLLLKTPPNPNDLYSSCYTIVLNSAKPTRPRGFILGRQDAGAERSLRQDQDASDEKTKGTNVWHSVRVQLDMQQISIFFDKQSPVMFIDTAPISYGHIGFLCAKGEVKFRNVIWLPSGLVPLFETEYNLKKSWRELKEPMQFTYTRDLGLFQMKGGPGIVESEQVYDNFVLQLEYSTAKTSARTGLFFRSIPEKPETGYEVSLQNFPTLQDRETEVGVDAGGFRRIKDARYVRATDLEWNYLTLVVTDRHYQTWINGVPVCEITDYRKRKAGAPTGPFLDAGTLQFFAPVAGTSVQYRNIKISPYSER